MEKKQTSRLLFLVAGVWAANTVAGIAAALIPGLEYEPDGSINGVFTAIAGLIFVADKVGHRGVDTTKSEHNTNDDSEEEVK